MRDIGRFRKSRKVVTINKRGLILCEGETEENYFTGLISQEKYRRKFASIDVDIYKPKNHSPLGLVNKAREMIRIAKREKNKYDFVWVIFDKDGHANMPDAFEIARNSNPEIKIAFTIPCFEFYVLLHFEKKSKSYDKCDDIISKIKKENYITDYEKACNIFELLLPNMAEGLENSKWISDKYKDEIDGGEKIYNLSVYSNIHELVEYLYSLI